MSFSADVLANIATELQRRIGYQDRFQRLITMLCQVLECDASALLRYDPRQLIPLAIDRLARDVLGGCFALKGHPRPEAIARVGDMVRFPADSGLSDPYDGLIPRQKSPKVRTYIGLLLFVGQNLIGALTLGGIQPDQFDVFNGEKLRLIAALAAGALGNALLIEQLESQDMLPGEAALLEVMKQTQTIGLSSGMIQLEKETEIMAASDLNVLISGETRTGKELMVKATHEASPRVVNLLAYLSYAASPESMAESELFGHVKGAFTDTISNRSRRFEMADNGTLSLDEIGELSLVLQTKLLRVLQYGDIQCVGDDCNLRVDMRVLAATNCDLREEVLAGRFRVDLFHRLSVFPLSVPPLRERGGDVILLVGYFREQCRLRLGPSRVILSAGARNLLQYYNFPGNARELGHAIHRVVVLARAIHSDDKVILEAQHFTLPEVTLPPPEVATAPVVRQNLREAIEAFQRETTRRALAQNHHNWAVCVWMLEANVANLHRLTKRLGLKD